MVEKVHKQDAHKIIVELTNSYAIAYELPRVTTKGKMNQEIAYSLVPLDNLWTRTPQNNNDCETDGLFSVRMNYWISKIDFPAKTQFSKLEDEITKTYQEIIKPADIQVYSYRDLKNKAAVTGIYCALTVAWPVLCPIALISSLVKQYSRGYLAAAAVLAPAFFIGSLCDTIKEVFKPSLKAFKVANQKALHTHPTDNDAALVLDSGANQNRFVYYSLAFADGLTADNKDYRICEAMEYHARRNNGNQKVHAKFRDSAIEYNSANNYINVPSQLKDKLYSAVKERDTMIDQWYEFNEQITKENHQELLKHIGFI